MGFFGFLIVGLICGTLAKAILKDRAVGGWLASLIIGVIGAFVARAARARVPWRVRWLPSAASY